MITLDEANAHIGAGVVYRPHPDARAEDGSIVRVTDFHVFVLYVGDRHPKATRPEDLTFLTPLEAPAPSVDADIVESLRRQSEFYAANPRVEATPDVDTVECVFCDEPIDPEHEDGDTAFDCAACLNGWHHYDCAHSCIAYLDDREADAAMDAATDARGGW